jgi:hypothetical protein
MRRVLFVVLLAVIASWSAGGGRASTAYTTLHEYSPFKGDSIAPDVRIARTVSGYCWTNSSADRAGAAFRCLDGNVIHDPCFANFALAHVNYVLCPLYHPGSNVLRIELTRQLPADRGTGDPNPMDFGPWAVKTTSGKWCERLTGATGRIAGIGISYRCEGGGVLLGEPRRRPTSWTTFYASGDGASRYRTIKLASVWWF